VRQHTVQLNLAAGGGLQGTARMVGQRLRKGLQASGNTGGGQGCCLGEFCHVECR
jgi:hypothetical protein